MDFVINLDMDGVLVDFEKGVMNNFGIDSSHLNKSRKQMSPEDAATKTQIYKNIKEMGVDFWANLEPMPDGMMLWYYVKSNFNNIVILTAYISSGIEDCKVGKREWVKKHLGLNPNDRNFICVKSNQKKDYVNHLGQIPSILIDDRPKNIKEWTDAGGIGILHTDSIDTIRQLKELTKEL